MLAVDYQGRVHRADRLTVDEFDALEGAGPAKIIASLLKADGVDPFQVRWTDVTVSEADDDLPSVWEDGLPSRGGRAMDSYVVAFGRPPWCWPPTVTRRQMLRDLALILAAAE